MIYDLAIIGGGPAGMMAGVSAGKKFSNICLLERNNALGKKLLLTGKGRCNLTTTKSIPEIVETFGKQGKFLYSALTRFSNQDLIKFFESKGVKTKTERGNRVFPESDRAESILNCLERELKKNQVKIQYKFRVVKISKQDNYFTLFSDDKQSIQAKKIIIASGGMSYPITGSTGDGYKLAKSLGHKIIPPKPALVALIVKNKDIRDLAGLTLKNINLAILADDKKELSSFGEMIFTHSGISGPIVLSASKQVYNLLKQNKEVVAIIDFKPVLSEKKLKNRIYRDIHTSPKKEYQSLLKGLLPKSIIPLFIAITKIDKHKQVSLLSSEEVSNLLNLLKNFSFAIDNTAPIESAIITSGGVNIKEIKQQTMESKIISNIYFSGEIIALDGPTGGYNLQKAWSTGWLAGQSLKS